MHRLSLLDNWLSDLLRHHGGSRLYLYDVGSTGAGSSRNRRRRSRGRRRTTATLQCLLMLLRQL